MNTAKVLYFTPKAHRSFAKYQFVYSTVNRCSGDIHCSDCTQPLENMSLQTWIVILYPVMCCRSLSLLWRPFLNVLLIDRYAAATSILQRHPTVTFSGWDAFKVSKTNDWILLWLVIRLSLLKYSSVPYHLVLWHILSAMPLERRKPIQLIIFPFLFFCVFCFVMFKTVLLVSVESPICQSGSGQTPMSSSCKHGNEP
jgi:hypothetical protein